MAKDPVCGATVDEKTAQLKSFHELNVYYFDSEKCKIEFDKNPQKYVGIMGMQHHASHYGGYCPTPGCSKPQKGVAWYLYVGLLLLISTILLLSLFARFLI